jgi:hypothetical protein
MTRALYTEGVQAHWGETTVGEHGEPLLDGLPFEPGQPVEMLVVSKTAGPATAGSEGFATAAISCSHHMLTSISPLFKHFQIRKGEMPRLPCYTGV